MATLRVEYWCASCDNKVYRYHKLPLVPKGRCPVCKEHSLQINYLEEVVLDEHCTEDSDS